MKTPAHLLILPALLVLNLGSTWAQEAPKKADLDPITDPAVFLEELPKDLIKDMKPDEKNFQENLAKASPMIASKAKDKPCEFEAVVGSVEKRFERGTTTLTGYTVVTRTGRIRASSTMFANYFNVMFDKSEGEKVTKLKPGQKFRFTGTTTGAGFMPSRQMALLIVGVKDAKLK